MNGPGGSANSSDPRRRAILDHARRHFIQDGFAATKIEPIAREAGVSTATLYALFVGKAELFDAVIEDAAQDFSHALDGVRAVEEPAREQLTRFAEAYAAFMGDPFVRSVFRLVVAERPRFQGVAAHFFERGRREIGATLLTMLTRMVEAGELKPLPKASWAAGQLMGMIENPVFFVPMVTGDDVLVKRSREEIAAQAVETFLARYGA
jgi:AcrR family transcriptional regulator